MEDQPRGETLIVSKGSQYKNITGNHNSRYVDVPPDDLSFGEYNEICGISDAGYKSWKKQNPDLNGWKLVQPSSLGNDTIVVRYDKPAGSRSRPPINGEEDPVVFSGRKVPGIQQETEVRSIQQETEDSGTHGETACISAIVQSKIGYVKDEIFRKLGSIFGCNIKPSSDTCGTIRAKIFCSSDSSHFSYYKHERCNDPDCPVCFGKFASRLAKGIVDRVLGYLTVKNSKFHHVIFWPDILTRYDTLKEAKRDAKRMCAKMGITSAAILYHPFRIRDDVKKKLRRYKRANGLVDTVGFWQLAHDDVLGLGDLGEYVVYGPHFHAIATGYLLDVREYKKLGIGGYKKLKRELNSKTEIERVANYLSTHACHEPGKQSVCYIGGMAPANLGREPDGERVVDGVCPVCSARLEERACDANGDVIPGDAGLVHHHTTTIEKQWRYFVRARKRRVWGAIRCRPGDPP